MVTSTHTLDVPGACLHYEVRGSGPVLLLIPGGAAESGMFAGMAPLLADDHTVVTYDPRGLSRSTLDGPARDIHVETQADDAHRLLATIATEPAYVFGNSGRATSTCSWDNMLGWITTYRPDAAALRATSTRIVVAGGTDSAGQVAHRAAVALADLLGTSLVDFPGDHGGFVGQPEAFAQTLRRVLTETA